MFFDFASLVTIDGFLIIFNMFLQILFYVYARHGSHGYYARHPFDGTTFCIHKSVWLTISLILSPLLVSVVIMATTGWKSVLVVISVQIGLFGLRGIEFLIKKCKSKSKFAKQSEILMID